MSSPKNDDGNRLMLKCSGSYIRSSADNQRTCESPEVMESITCPVDRAGNSIYTCFNMSGDQDIACRNTCLHGHLQDFSRTLWNPDVAGAYPLYWEERGVELYENFGLSEVVRDGAGSYTYGSTDKNASNASYGSYCDRNSIGAGTWPSCKNTCHTELGRKLTLFGQLGFTIIEDWNDYSQVAADYTVTGGFVLPSQYTHDFAASAGRRFYLINYYRTAPNLTSDYVDQYDYFGNSGVIFKDADDIQYYFIYGQDPFIINNGARSSPTSTQLGYLMYDSDRRALLINVKYFNENASYVGIRCGKIPQAILIKPNNCQTSPNMDQIDLPALAFPFPSNLNAQVFCDVSYSSFSNRLSPNPNCYYSGVRSMYIPPHMKVTGFSHMKYVDQSKNWTSDYGAVKYQFASETGFKPFTYKDSPYKNGTFPSLGGVKANSPYDDSTSQDQYSSDTWVKGGAYTNPPIYNCSLAGIWVDVRRDGEFRSIYVPDRFYNSNYVYPEIFLMPGIENAARFQADTTSTIRTLDPIQSILNPEDLWTDLNPYWTSKYQIEFDRSKNPYDALPVSAVVASQAKIIETAVRLTPKLDATRKLARIIGNFAQTPIRIRKNLSLTAVTYTDKPYVGQGRIKTFAPVNGIMSIEWIYVIYRCAFSYQPGQSNTITYDSGTYTFGDNTSRCGAECALYRDPYYTANPSAQNISAADMMMKTICGMKTYSMAYGQFSNPTSNDCACVSSAGYCPNMYNPNCSAYYTGQDQHYVSDQIVDEVCQTPCTYCNTVVVQINMADHNSNLDDGVNSNELGPTCAANTQCTQSSDTDQYDDPGDGTSTTTQNPDPPPDPPAATTDDKKNWMMLVAIIIVLLLIAVIVFVGWRTIKFRK